MALGRSVSFVVALLLTVSAFAAIPLIPNADWTTGSLCTVDNIDYSGLKYPEQIPWCERNVEYPLKEKIYDQYEIPVHCRHRYTIDHLIPLSIGGSNERRNLWPEHKLVKQMRPFLEQEVFDQVASGKLMQKHAVEIILREKFSPMPALRDAIKEDCDSFATSRDNHTNAQVAH